MLMLSTVAVPVPTVMMASLVASLMVGLAFLTLGKLRMIEPALAAPLALSRNPSPSRTAVPHQASFG